MVTLAHVSVLFGAVLLSLMGFQLALRLPGGQGIEDVFGWVNLASVATAVRQWCGTADPTVLDLAHVRWRFAAVYVLVDTYLFMPVYAVLMLLAGAHLRDALRRGRARPGLRRWQWPVTVAAVCALLLVDAAENHGGAMRIGLSVGLFWSCLACGAGLGAMLWSAGRFGPPRIRRSAQYAAFAAFVLGSALAGWAFFGDSPPTCATEAAQGLAADSLGALAHGMKSLAAVVAAGVVALAAIAWLYGVELDRDEQARLRSERAAMRAGAMTIIGRTRYVLVVLTLFIALTLALDQGRDVLLGLARWPKWWELSTVEGWYVLLALLSTVLGIGLFVYSTWLWARLGCRVQRLGTFAVAMRSADERGGLPATSDAVRIWLGHFARIWARALSIVPLLCVYALTAYALSDASLAAAAMAGDGVPTDTDAATRAIWMLVLFGAMSVGLGVSFLWVRGRLALPDPRAYYNDVPDVHALLRAEDTGVRRPLQGTFLRLLEKAEHWLTPRALPLAALGLMVLLRAGMALAPGQAAGAPAALALVAFTLTWWLGVFGALALAEEAHGRPYVLVVLLIAGLLSLLGMSDNHVLPLALPAGDPGSLARLRLHHLGLVASLSVSAAALWLLYTQDLRRLQVAMWLQRWGRLIGTVVIVLLAVSVLRVFDALVPSPAKVAEARPALVEALDGWAEELEQVRPARGPVFLVASEGGGIRSAYWTAQVLRHLRTQFPDFDRRTFVLSGVSGGAVGIAAYTACLRKEGRAASAAAMKQCLDGGFGQLDALSPLLGAWMFEDALARVLPASMGESWYACRHPACGHLSRALPFEREWMRAFPTMALPLQTVRAGEPHLLLNSTWVETGELAPAASIALDTKEFPGVRDVQARLGHPLNLIGAAHVAARFPFINPLAGIQPRSDETNASARDELIGHLADGGYFDNSAATSLAGVWHAMKQRLDPERHGLEPILVLIRNGRQPVPCDRVDPAGPEPECIAPPRLSLSDPEVLRKPTDRRNWGLYADVLGPAVAVLNVSGIGAHGRHAAATLSAEFGEPQPPGRPARVLVIDQFVGGALVPLGWYLSLTARQALDHQAECMARELRHRYAPSASNAPLCDAPSQVKLPAGPQDAR